MQCRRVRIRIRAGSVTCAVCRVAVSALLEESVTAEGVSWRDPSAEAAASTRRQDSPFERWEGSVTTAVTGRPSACQHWTRSVGRARKHHLNPFISFCALSLAPTRTALEPGLGAWLAVCPRATATLHCTPFRIMPTGFEIHTCPSHTPQGGPARAQPHDKCPCIPYVRLGPFPAGGVPAASRTPNLNHHQSHQAPWPLQAAHSPERKSMVGELV